MAAAWDFDDFSGPGNTPSKAEQRLIAACAKGELARCKGSVEDRTVSAKLIAALATESLRRINGKPQALHASGLRLINANVRGRLDLSNRTVPANFKLQNCDVHSGFDCANARFSRELYLRRCRFKGMCRMVATEVSRQVDMMRATFDNSGGKAILAQEIRAAGWRMDGAIVSGEFDINSALITGQFGADRASFTHKNGSAICAQGVKAADWFMNGATVTGEFDINSAEITGQFKADNATFTREGGRAIWAQGVKVADWFMHGATVTGELDINSAEIAGQFGANEATFTREGGEAIQAGAIKAAHWFMDGATVTGEINIAFAEIAGQFRATNAGFANTGGRAVLGLVAHFGGGFILCKAPKKTGSRHTSIVDGEVNLTGARIEKRFDLSGAQIRASRHRALSPREAVIECDADFSSATFLGHIHAARAQFKGRVMFKGTKLSAASYARHAGELQPEIGETFHAADEERQERLKHHALSLAEARITGRLVLPEERPRGIVDLSRASCDTLEDHANGWMPPLGRGTSLCRDRLCVPETSPSGAVEQRDIQHVVLDGFEYRHLEYPDGRPEANRDVARARIAWLSGQAAGHLKSHFNPQPWRQAAGVLRAMGYEEAARTIAIERRVRERLADGVPWFRRFISCSLHWLADYGFNPWKTIGISVLVVAACAIFYEGAVRNCGGAGKAFETDSHCGGTPLFVKVREGDVEKTKNVYPPFHALFHSFDLFVPFIDFGEESYWRANPNAMMPMSKAPDAWKFPLGSALYIVSVLEQIAGAVLIILAGSGFTGLLTRDQT